MRRSQLPGAAPDRRRQQGAGAAPARIGRGRAGVEDAAANRGACPCATRAVPFWRPRLPCSLTQRASAQPAWPAAPIRFVVAFPPGGPSDILGRMVAQKITEQQGWTVVVENRSGASGLVGMGEVARAAPDGYTVLINASAHSILPATHAMKVGFDIARPSFRSRCSAARRSW